METSSESVDLHEFKTQMCLMLASYKQLDASSQSAAKKLLISKLDILSADHKLTCIENQSSIAESSSSTDKQLLITSSSSSDNQLLTASSSSSSDNQLLTASSSSSTDNQLLTTSSNFTQVPTAQSPSNKEDENTAVSKFSADKPSLPPTLNAQVSDTATESTLTAAVTGSVSADNNNNNNNGSSSTGSSSSCSSVQSSRFACPLTGCQTVFSHRKALIAHVRWQHDPAAVSCLSCRQKLDTVAHYLYHRQHCFVGANALVCAECGARFSQRVAYRRHVAGHAANRCSRCDCSLSSRKALVKHLRHVHAVIESEKWHICPHCPRKFMKKRSLVHHSKVHASVDQVQCDRCGMNVSRVDLARHLTSAECLRSASVNRQFYCHPCQRWFARNQQYQQHCRLHERNTCSACSSSFASKSDYLHHISHAHSTPISADIALSTSLITSSDDVIACRHLCQVCGDAFISHAALCTHLSTHDTDKLVCFVCEVHFSTPLELHRHLRRTSCSRPCPRPLTCPNCSDKFRSQLHLRRHLTQKHSRSPAVTVPTTDAASRDISAGVANTGFTFGSQDKALKSPIDQSAIAIVTESSDNNAVCAAQSLDRHHHSGRPSVATTTSQPPAPPATSTSSPASTTQHICQHCGLSYSSRSNLVRHLSAHWRQTRRSYVCDQCASAFFTLSALRDHQLYRHSVQRAHACSVCGKAFKTGSALARHARSHSPTRAYRCHCGQTYKRMSHLRRHMLSVHQMRTRTRRVEHLIPNSARSPSPTSPVPSAPPPPPVVPPATECVVYGVEWSELVVADPAALAKHTTSVAVLETAGSDGVSAAGSADPSPPVVTYVLCQSHQQSSATHGLTDANCLPPASSICTHH